MKVQKYILKPDVEIELSEEEIEFLIKCSQIHYDIKCKDASAYGGFIYGLKNYSKFVKEGEPIMYSFTHKQIDLMAKICEVSSYTSFSDQKFSLLGIKFINILNEMNKMVKEVDLDKA